MGRTGRSRLAGIAVHLAAVLLLIATACGGDSPAISELLLAPDDFPGRLVTRTGVQTGQTSEGQPTAITEFVDSGFIVQHSLVIFDTPGTARAALAGVSRQWEQLAADNDGTTLFRDGLAPLAITNPELVAGVLEEVRSGNQTSSMIFIQGSVLVRLTVSGAPGKEQLLAYAEQARVKAERR